MIQPVDLKEPRRIPLPLGGASTTTDVWAMLLASRDGDLGRVTSLLSRDPGLLRCEYGYATPLHFAVREGHVNLTRYLLEHGALDPTYYSDPFRDSLLTMALDREYAGITELLQAQLARPNVDRPDGAFPAEDTRDPERRRFQQHVDQNALVDVEAMLRERPDLAKDELAFWGEGILMMPAHDRHPEMLELLMRYGACVPDVAKWGREYYFKHYDMAVLLMERGMNPSHMTWQHVTLLHHMPRFGDIQKASLLVDHGAEINPIDEEYRSTPLGLAARDGKREMVAFLLERGADPNAAGAPWATPLAWARKKGHAEVEEALRRAGANAPS